MSRGPWPVAGLQLQFGPHDPGWLLLSVCLLSFYGLAISSRNKQSSASCQWDNNWKLNGFAAAQVTDAGCWMLLDIRPAAESLLFIATNVVEQYFVAGHCTATVSHFLASNNCSQD